jgi:hypothetical protein
MTPMQILKNNMETFAENISIQFKDVNLNKAEPKVKFIQTVSDDYALAFPNEEGGKVIEKKGVRTDFLRLFQAKTKSDNYSIGFHFTYIGKDEEDFRVACSLKTLNKQFDRENLIVSPEMTIEEFKEKINPLNLLIKEKNFSVEEVAQLVSDAFIVPEVTNKPKMR